ncbi:hydroxyectoine utilization dehydratase EutB [Pelagibacterium sp. H642]|uniref:hydroxyectoine utilization dehydratase EutB n=1 Tax=Pelagibacterium sp. H642 TaxID=1881069 RepID=UPI002816831C|nr:hydroxyectoine utilization dehydratase EutB [Pelagibacterium sp. H642]WMT91669.1 hydroxyectoine utilization dehydratase EutB [Pelagibacterium sp. H642]
MADAVTMVDVLEARRRIGSLIHRTSLSQSAALTQRTGQPILLKNEHQQLTGSFKLRGATNAVLALSDDERRRGVAAASTGNHGRALAHAAKAAGSRAVICMSSLVPANKVEAIKALGADARIIGMSQDDAQVEVDRLVREEGLIEVPPFDKAEVIAGQGTLGLEIVEDAPALDAVLVPLSGGGLIAGVALAVKTLSPKTRVIGVSMERGAAMVACLAAGKPVMVEELETLADSLGGGIGLENRHTFSMVRELVDETILLTEREIAAGIAHAYNEEREVIEGAAAVGIGAILAGKFAPAGPTAVVLSGKNIDMGVHGQIVAGTHPVFGELA